MSTIPKLIPVILAGGSGTRLWPLSRQQYPKQFHCLLNAEQSMLQLTLTRLSGLSGLAAPIVITGEDYRFLVSEQLRAIGINDATIVLEPMGRGTAGAIALAALLARQRPNAQDDDILLILAADHQIEDVAALHRAIAHAATAALNGRLATFGIPPTSPHTGYGYIRIGTPQAQGWRGVEAFAEKPDHDTARAYLDSGAYLWNGGMFMFTPPAILQALQTYAPLVLSQAEIAFRAITHDLGFHRLDRALFAQVPDVSIDVAVMEKIVPAEPGSVVVVPLKAGWSDIGSWGSLWEALPHDQDSNTLSGDVWAEDTRNTLVHAAGDRLVAVADVDDLVVVDTPDALLVTRRDGATGTRKILERLKVAQRPEVTGNTKVFRPWGWYDTVQTGPGFKVKRIAVNPGAALSLQSHKHRAEHWVVVAGTAEVQVNEDISRLGLGQSVAIPLGAIHRLSNPGINILEIIEVQTGGYLGEDDIIRYEDVYGRTG